MVMRKHITSITLLIGFLLVPIMSHADGQALYMKNCKKCHGETGKGDTLMGKKLKIVDYTTAEAQAKVTDEAIAKSIKEGLKNEAGKKVMLAFGKKLSDPEVAELLTYFRTLKK